MIHVIVKVSIANSAFSLLNYDFVPIAIKDKLSIIRLLPLIFLTSYNLLKKSEKVSRYFQIVSNSNNNLRVNQINLNKLPEVYNGRHHQYGFSRKDRNEK